MAEVKITVKNVVEGAKDVPKTAANYQKLNKGINTIAASMGAVAAAGLTFKKAFDLSREGASINQLEESFNRMNTQVFQTPGLLDDMTRAAQGTVKKTDLMAGLLTLTAGATDEVAKKFAEAAPRLIEIAKASNKLNPALGDTTFLFDSISKGIKRQSPLILDNLGILVKAGPAYKEYADSIGKTVEQLTANEKTLAFLNATMRGGDQLINQVGGSVDSQTDSWDRLSVQISTATDTFKQWMATRLEGVVGGATRVIDEEALAYEELNAAVAAGIITQTDYNHLLKFGTIGLTTVYSDRQKEVRRELRALNEETQIADNIMLSYGGQLTSTEKAALTYTNSLGNMYAEMNKGTSFSTWQENMEANNEMMEEAKSKALEAATAQRELQQGLRDTATAAAAAAQSEFATTLTESLRGANEEFGQWVTTATIVGARTEEQDANFTELSDSAEKLRDNIRSLQGGTAGLGLTESELNDKLAEQYEKLALVEGAMAPLAEQVGEYSNVSQQWVVDAEAMNNTLFDQITANTDNEIAITAAGIALGLYDEAQVEAALNAAIINEKINQLAEEFIETGMSAGELRGRMDDIVAGSPYTSEIEVLTDKANKRIDATRSKLDAIDGLVAKAEIQITESTRKVGDSSGAGQAPGRAVGGPVMANQPYFVHQNEVFIPNTSGQIVSGEAMGNVTINIDARGADSGAAANIEQAVDRAMAKYGRQASSRIRT